MNNENNQNENNTLENTAPQKKKNIKNFLEAFLCISMQSI
jgi:hypothetical protein